MSKIRTNVDDLNQARRSFRQVEGRLERPYRVVVMTDEDEVYDAQFGDLVDVTTSVATPRVNLPDIARHRGRAVTVKRSTSQEVLIWAANGQTLDGEPTYRMTRPRQSATFVCVDESRWVVVGD